MNLKEKVRTQISQVGLMNKEEIDVIVDKTNVDSFKKGTILLREGQIPSKCYMVVEGCVREYLIVDGEEKSTSFFTEGDTFAPYANDGKEAPSRHYWVCVEDCVLTISNQSFEEELRASLPRLDAIFQEIAVAKIKKAKEEWSLFVSSSPEERYLNLLNTRPFLFNRIAHRHIASYLGMKPQSLSRIRKRIMEKKKEESS